MDKLKRYHYSDVGPVSEFWCRSEGVAALESENAALEKQCAELDAANSQIRQARRHWENKYLKAEKRCAELEEELKRCGIITK